MIFSVFRHDTLANETKKIGSSDSKDVAREIAVSDAINKSYSFPFAYINMVELKVLAPIEDESRLMYEYYIKEEK